MITLLNLRLNCCRHHMALSQRSLSTIELKKYYKLLDVDKNSSTKEIKNSFLRLSKIYHPDNKDTGSHLKFVQLKEAYDAVKDGPPATTYDGATSSSSSSAYSPYSSRPPPTSTTNSYSNYDFYSDLGYQSQFRDRERAYRMGYQFGGPYARRPSPWEDLLRDRAYRRQKQSQDSQQNRQFKPLVSLTLLLSAIAWIVISSGFAVLFDSRNSSRDRTNEYENYLSLEEAIKRRAAFEARQISYKDSARIRQANTKQTYVKKDSEDNEQYSKNDQGDNVTTTNRTTSTSGDQRITTTPASGEPAKAKT